MVSVLVLGATLTLLAWVCLQVAIIHGNKGGSESIIFGIAGKGILRRILFDEVLGTVERRVRRRDGDSSGTPTRPIGNSRVTRETSRKGARATNLGE